MGGRGSSTSTRKRRDTTKTLIDTEKDTKDLHTKDGKYTASREKVHKKIVKQILKQSSPYKEGTQPVAIIVSGGSGVGKSNIRDRSLIPYYQSSGYKKLAVLDPDLIQKSLPEYKKLMDKGYDNTSSKLYRESKNIQVAGLKALVGSKRSFIIDTTMSNTANYVNTIKTLRKRGYVVELHHVTAPLDVAIERVNSRYSRTGRKVPIDVVKNSHKASTESFKAVKRLVNNFTVYDTSKGGSPTVIGTNKIQAKTTKVTSVAPKPVHRDTGRSTSSRLMTIKEQQRLLKKRKSKSLKNLSTEEFADKFFRDL